MHTRKFEIEKIYRLACTGSWNFRRYNDYVETTETLEHAFYTFGYDQKPSYLLCRREELIYFARSTLTWPRLFRSGAKNNFDEISVA